jgi:hypothetical protein
MEANNAFENEMHQDNAPLAQPPGTAREIRNMRMVSSDGSNFSVASAEGTIVSGSVNPGFIPIGSKGFVDLLALFSFNPTSGRSEIGIFSASKITRVGDYTPVYVNDELDFDLDHAIEARGIIESSEKYITYFWDNKNTTRVCNVIDARFADYYTAGATLTPGLTYMVLQGSILHNAIDYGPNETDNIFVAANNTFADNAIPGLPALVIPYIPVESFSIVPKVGFNIPRFNARIAGGLTCGTYYYFYRLTDDSGNGTEYSMPSAPIYINNRPVSLPGSTDYLDANMDGDNNDVASSWGVEMIIDYIDDSYTKVELVYIKAVDENTFEAPIIFDILDIAGTSITFQHTSNLGVTTLVQEDLIRGRIPFIKNKIGDISKNTLFIGNFETVADPIYDMSQSCSTYIIKQLVPCDETEVITGVNPGAQSGPPADKMFSEPLYGVYGTGVNGLIDSNPQGGVGFEGCWYFVEGVNAVDDIELINTITGIGIFPVAGGSYFQWPAGYDSWTVASGAPKVFPVIRINLYGSEIRYIKIANDYFSGSGMAMNHYIRSGWRAETYRAAICLNDNFGNPLYAHHIADITMPDHNETDGEMMTEINNNDTGLFTPQYRHVLNHLGIKFSDLDFNLVVTGLQELYNDNTITLADLPDYFDGFSIVLCKRDKVVYAEGLLSPIIYDSTFASYVPASTPRVNFCGAFADNGFRTLNAFFLRSPDMQFGIGDIPIDIEEGDFLEVKEYMDVFNPQAAFRGTLINEDTGLGHYFYYSKLYNVGSPTVDNRGQTNLCDPEYCKPFLAAEDTAFIGPSQINFTYRGRVNCTVGTTWTGQADHGYCTKNHGSLFWTREDSASNRFAYELARVDNPATPTGMLPVYAAFKKRKSNLYGGTSVLAKSLNEYFFCGHYQRFDATFMAYLVGNAGIASDIEIFGLDTYLELWDHVLSYQERGGPAPYDIGIGIIMPVQNNVHLRFRQGRNFAHEKIYDAATDGVAFSYLTAAQPYQPEQLVLNRAYRSSSAWNVPILAIPYQYSPNRFYSKTIAFSLRKTDGEFRDNLRRFIPGNTLDVENKYGSLTNLKEKQGYLIFIQEGCFGYIPVQERVTIANAVGQPVNIGTNDTIDRYENTNTFFGSRHQFSLTEDEKSLFWYDATNQCICRASISGETVELSVMKGLWGLFRSKMFEVPVTDTPVNQLGIMAGFDNENKEVLFTFRGIEQVVTGEDTSFTLAINSLNGNMRAYMDFHVGLYIMFNGNLYSSSLKHDYPTVADGGNYVVGDLIKNNGTKTNELYIVHTAFTANIPADDLSTDPNVYAVRNDENIHAHNVGDICSFHGLVYDSSIQVVAISQDKKDAIWEHYIAEINGSGIKFSSLVVETSRQSGTDTDIETSPEHEIIDTHLEGNIPFSDDDQERMTGPYLLMKFIKDHKTNAVTSNNEKAELLVLTTYHKKAY